MPVEVGPLAELPPGTVRRVEAAGRAVLVANLDGRLSAVDDACLHRGASLALGRVQDGWVTCASHWWRYDLRTGALAGGAGACLRTYPVRAVDGMVVIDVPAAEPVRSMREILLAHARNPLPPDPLPPVAADKVVARATTLSAATGQVAVETERTSGSGRTGSPE